MKKLGEFVFWWIARLRLKHQSLDIRWDPFSLSPHHLWPFLHASFPLRETYVSWTCLRCSIFSILDIFAYIDICIHRHGAEEKKQWWLIMDLISLNEIITGICFRIRRWHRLVGTNETGLALSWWLLKMDDAKGFIVEFTHEKWGNWGHKTPSPASLSKIRT